MSALTGPEGAADVLTLPSSSLGLGGASGDETTAAPPRPVKARVTGSGALPPASDPVESRPTWSGRAASVAAPRRQLTLRQRAARINDRGRTRAKQLELSATVSTDEIESLIQRPCNYCGDAPAGGVDHVVPLAQGGHHVTENLQPCCLPCNDRKGVRLDPSVCRRGHEDARHGVTFTYRSGPRRGLSYRTCRACIRERVRERTARARAA